jgi:hypothetical protein
MEYTPEQIVYLRRTFRRRRSVRIGIFILILSVLDGVTLLAFPSWKLFGMSKMTWAPYFYLVMFALLFLIALVWRCPACNGLLGDVFQARYCPKCGLKLSE